MDDIAAITALVHRYADLLDGGDIEGVVALFANATWRSAARGEVLRGHDEIKAVYDRVILYDGIPRTRHLMTNLIIELDESGDEASGRLSFTVLQQADDASPIAPVVSGQYHDRYRRGPEGWHFTDRLFIVDLVGDQSRHFG